MNNAKPLGISGRIAALFQSAPITPLLAVMALLLGGFAVLAVSYTHLTLPTICSV